MSPRNCTGRERASARRGAPARITASAPSTGSSAADAGERGRVLKANAPSEIAASPSHDSGRRRAARRAGARASSPPAPNSHARVGVTK